MNDENELVLQTARLTLRPFTEADAEEVERLAGERDIAATTELVPHPYPRGAGLAWIRTHEELRAGGAQYSFAVIRRVDDRLVACASLKVVPGQRIASIGYWVGKPYWRQGIATEAAAAVLAFGFETLRLHKIVARVFSRNTASQRVLRRLGLAREGHRPRHFLKWGVYEDIDEYGLLRDDYLRRDEAGAS